MFYCESCRIKNEWPEAYSVSYGKCECCGAVDRCYDRPSSTLPPVRRASPAAAVPEGALPPLPEHPHAAQSRHWSAAEAEAIRNFARAAVEADRARQQQSGHMPPFAAPAGQHGASLEVLTEILTGYLRREMPGGTVISRSDWWAVRIARAISHELASRCRAQGGDGDPEAVDVSADRAQQGEPVASDDETEPQWWFDLHAAAAALDECGCPASSISVCRIANELLAATKAAAPADAPLCPTCEAEPARNGGACGVCFWKGAAPAPDAGIPTAGEVPEAEMSPLYKQALEMVRESSRGSVAMVQRRLRIGWAEAENLIHTMVQRGDISHEITSGVRQSGRAPAPTTHTSGEVEKYPHPDCDWACHYHCTEAGAHPPRCDKDTAPSHPSEAKAGEDA